jgi:23S rRNA (cytosine1962-C5)-methyltransferase
MVRGREGAGVFAPAVDRWQLVRVNRPQPKPHAASRKPQADEVVVSKKGVERLRLGHLWIYRSDLKPAGNLLGGDVVRLVDERGWFLGKAFWGAHSQISVRLLTRDDEEVDEAFFERRISRAAALREEARPDPERHAACRLVHGEADFLPGLIVDRYGDCLSIQTLIEATDARREMFADILQRTFSPRAIVERNDVKIRAHEGLPLRKGVLRGQPPGPIEFREGDVTLLADLLEGQKTGAFLDQAENRIEAGRYARGRALDCFTYGGAFALHLAKRAKTVVAVDISERAAEEGRRAAARNNAANLEFKVANAFDLLKDESEAGERYDTIVLDPPAFAKNKASIEPALRGYKEINLRAFQLLSPGGTLITASCSFHIDDATFEKTIHAAANDARRTVQIVERRGASRDHPTLLGMPETRYLKCLIVRAL